MKRSAQVSVIGLSGEKILPGYCTENHIHQGKGQGPNHSPDERINQIVNVAELRDEDILQYLDEEGQYKQG